MISQRDITAFFTILDVLADPEKAKAELKVLQDIRATIDSDLERVKKIEEEANGKINEANAIVRSHDQRRQEIEAIEARSDARANNLRLQEEKIAKAQAEQATIIQRIKEREAALSKKEGALSMREGLLKSREEDYNTRNEGLRAKEADFSKRMSKLRQIAE